jgi:hypothetical protein
LGFAHGYGGWSTCELTVDHEQTVRVRFDHLHLVLEGVGGRLFLDLLVDIPVEHDGGGVIVF